MAKPLMVDADGHILEPPDAYERHIEPKYRERAMRLKFDDQVESTPSIITQLA